MNSKKASLALVMLFFVFCFSYNAEVFIVEGDSMYPTFGAETCSRVILTVNKPIYIPFPKLGTFDINQLSNKLDLVSPLKRGDIVIIEREGRCLLKRIIGIPHDRLQVIKNDILINGEYFKSYFIKKNIAVAKLRRGNSFFSYNIKASKQELFTKNFTLGFNEYFYMGDNRIESKDSRHYGLCTGKEIKKRYIFTVGKRLVEFFKIFLIFSEKRNIVD